MATGLFYTPKKRNGSFMENSVEDQISEIRAEIASLANLLSKRGAETSNDVRSKAAGVRDSAEAGMQDLIENAEHVFAELRDRYASTEKQVRTTVREHPIATIGAAAALGIFVAALIRR